MYSFFNLKRMLSLNIEKNSFSQAQPLRPNFTLGGGGAGEDCDRITGRLD